MLSKSLFGALIGALSLTSLPAFANPHDGGNIHKLTFVCQVDLELSKARISVFQGQEGHGSVLFEGSAITAIGANSRIERKGNLIVVTSKAADFEIDLTTERKVKQPNGIFYTRAYTARLTGSSGAETMECVHTDRISQP